MKKKLQIDNPVHPNKVSEREKALAVLEKAKAIPRKVVFLRQGESKEVKNYRK
ncbi:hypothetical protein ACFQO9_11185 [Chryseobacterium zhengzhouense]|uniref:Uncharacterized protein n=1 Tax=Chryseobacterium zhengzhouense TaxID=1636086 RepID=A0ABW2LXG1_9FLAO